MIIDDKSGVDRRSLPTVDVSTVDYRPMSDNPAYVQVDVSATKTLQSEQNEETADSNSIIDCPPSDVSGVRVHVGENPVKKFIDTNQDVDCTGSSASKTMEDVAPSTKSDVLIDSSGPNEDAILGKLVGTSQDFRCEVFVDSRIENTSDDKVYVDNDDDVRSNIPEIGLTVSYAESSSCVAENLLQMKDEVTRAGSFSPMSVYAILDDLVLL
jgi:hypothetical protein